MMTGRYIVYGGELSYFTRKLEAALIFYGIDYEIRAKTPDIRELVETRAGTHQVPVLHTPENWMIADTTPLLSLLDARLPHRRLFPAGPLGVLVHVVEEYFDEWIARTMVHYRWHYPASAEFASLRMAAGNAEAAARVRDWGPRACRATGTDSETQQRAAEAEYARILAAMESQLAETPYLLGDRPTAVDCVLLGGLRAHTNMDPDPKAVTAGYPRVVAWSEGGADGWDGSGTLAPFPESTAFARFVLTEMVETYQPYVLANRDAQSAGAKAFHARVYDEDVSYLSRPYPEQSRQMIVDRIENQLSTEEREVIRGWLDAVGLRTVFA
jgi:glutathione S-transferase